jgi:AraC family transcriptional regulator
MEMIKSLQQGIRYMENHLLDPITYQDVAKHLHLSNYHFHKTFSLVTGLTVGEYLRNRRLSLAGEELAMSTEKVLNVALKYGYETPESFTKAFTRFHGVSPRVLRDTGGELKQFNPLLIKISIEGGRAMDYRLEKREGFQLLTKVREFSNDNSFETDNNEIAKFWEESQQDGTFKTLHQNSLKGDMYGVCGPIAKESDRFRYGIGVLGGSKEVPAGFEIWEVEPTLWAVFKCIGEDPGCIGKTWERIFKEFLPGSEYQMLEQTDFELYSDDLDEGCFCEIWIPVEKK